VGHSTGRDQRSAELIGESADLLKCSSVARQQGTAADRRSRRISRDECVELCNEIIGRERLARLAKSPSSEFELPKPREIFNFLRRRSQEAAKKALLGRGLQPLRASAPATRYTSADAVDRRWEIAKSNIHHLVPPGAVRPTSPRLSRSASACPSAVADATAHRGRLRRGRREHPPQAHPGRRLRCVKRAETGIIYR
jgi:ATP-dependent Clp protease ATP-binding subunit ClpX